MANDAFGLIGKVLGGQFRVDEVVGEGGFSVVYKGFHMGLKEPVAIKCLRLPQLEKKELADQFAHRFRDESRIAYRLSQGNLNIVRSITSGTTQDARNAVVPYMVLEWLNGRTLADELRERRASGHRGRSVGEVIQLFASVAEALSYAHSHGVIHRDVKPQNLFLAETREGTRLKVLDFGMAKILSDGTLGVAPLAQSLGTSVPVFSPPYAAPEQFDWKVGLVGTWTDVYSLSLILLEALADKRVRSGESLAECMVQACDPKRKIRPRDLGVPLGDAVDEVFTRALALKPKERPQDMNELWNQLLAAQANDAARSASIPVIGGDTVDEVKTAVTDTRSLFSEADLGRARRGVETNTAPTAFQPVGPIAGETPSDAPTLSLEVPVHVQAIPPAAGVPRLDQTMRMDGPAPSRGMPARLDQTLVTPPPVHEGAAPNRTMLGTGPVDPQIVAARAAAFQAAAPPAAAPPVAAAAPVPVAPRPSDTMAAAPVSSVNRPAPLNRTLGLGVPLPAAPAPVAPAPPPAVPAGPYGGAEFGPDPTEITTMAAPVGELMSAFDAAPPVRRESSHDATAYAPGAVGAYPGAYPPMPGGPGPVGAPAPGPVQSTMMSPAAPPAPPPSDPAMRAAPAPFPPGYPNLQVAPPGYAAGAPPGYGGAPQPPGYGPEGQGFPQTAGYAPVGAGYGPPPASPYGPPPTGAADGYVNVAPPPKKSQAGLLVVLGVAGVLVLGAIGAGAYYFTRARLAGHPSDVAPSATSSAPPAPPSSAVASAVASVVAAPEPTPSASVVVAPVESTAPAAVSAPPPAEPPPVAPPDPTVEAKPVETKPVETKPVETKPVETKPRSPQTGTPVAVAPRPPAPSAASSVKPEAPPVDPNAFNPDAAKASLRAMEGILASCKKPDGPTGPGAVKVTFANAGNVSSAQIVGAPYEGTPVGDCAVSRFRMARVKPFEGAPGVVDYAFRINK